MGVNIVLIMFVGLVAFLIASFLKARYYHGCPLIRSIIITLESPTCFLSISRRSIIYAWEKPKQEWGAYANLWTKISMVFNIIADWFNSIHLLHSLTIGAMVELAISEETNTIDEVLHKKGIFVLNKTKED